MTGIFGHDACDALLPTALAIVDAVHCDDPARYLEEIVRAERDGGPHWRGALVMVLASLVPQDATVPQLTAWMKETPA